MSIIVSFSIILRQLIAWLESLDPMVALCCFLACLLGLFFVSISIGLWWTNKKFRESMFEVYVTDAMREVDK